MKDILKNKFLSKLHTEDKAGLYITVTVHVMALIVLLASQISSAVKTDSSYLFDFSHIEEAERQEEEARFRETIDRRLDELIAAAPVASSEIRNIAVDASNLSDDRNTDVEALYRDAERLAAELKSKQALPENDMSEEFADMDDSPAKEADQDNDREYTGPSVVSYSLDGRKAYDLSIPAYRCLGGGDVTVIITVDPQGNVINAKIYDEVSSTDRCLREFAIRAARLSRFSVLPPDRIDGMARQKGEIVYRFIAQ